MKRPLPKGMLALCVALSLVFIAGCGADDDTCPPNSAEVRCDVDEDGVTSDLDIDDDGDGLIEIYTLEQLDWIRNDLYGRSLIDHDGVVQADGCEVECNGYELMNDLSFDTNGNGEPDVGDFYYDYDHYGSFLTDDDDDNYGWLPIGSRAEPFVGVFEGNGHEISHLYIDRPISGDAGLFGVLGALGSALGAEVRNLHLVGEASSVTSARGVGSLAGIAFNTTFFNVSSAVAVHVTGDYGGGLVGIMTTSSIDEGSSTGNVTAGYAVAGGLVGWATFSSISGSSASGDVVILQAGSSAMGAGGLVARADTLTIEASSASGNVTGDTYVGGLLGWAEASGSITNSHATGDVSGYEFVGGLHGNGQFDVTGSSAAGAVTGFRFVGGLAGSSSADLDTSSATGPVSGDFSAGGLVGRYSQGTITRCHATGDTSGAEDVGEGTGGLVGTLSSNGRIVESHATGNVSGFERIGGLVGAVDADASIVESHATGNVSGTDRIGGLIGNLNGASAEGATIGASYALGEVSGDRYIGGLVGLMFDASIDASFATGPVDGSSLVGGFAGDVNSGSAIRASYSIGVVNEGVTGTRIGAFIGYIDHDPVLDDNVHDAASPHPSIEEEGPSQTLTVQSMHVTGLDRAALSCPYGEPGVVCGFAGFADWVLIEDAEAYPYWDFGTDSQLPGLMIDGVVHRDSDGDGVLD